MIKLEFNPTFLHLVPFELGRFLNLFGCIAWQLTNYKFDNFWLNNINLQIKVLNNGHDRVKAFAVTSSHSHHFIFL